MQETENNHSDEIDGDKIPDGSILRSWQCHRGFRASGCLEMDMQSREGKLVMTELGFGFGLIC